MGLAMSIWKEGLIEEMGNLVYRLKTLGMQFVTIQLTPTVDVAMWTELENQNDPFTPVFTIKFLRCDPNIQLLPGVGVSAEQLYIGIQLVGELRPSQDGKGVRGNIVFVVSGVLAPPMRLLSDAML